jgi:hypothetical protein
MSPQAVRPTSSIDIMRQLIEENKILLEAFLASERKLENILIRELASGETRVEISKLLRTLIHEIRASIDRVSFLQYPLEKGTNDPQVFSR